MTRKEALLEQYEDAVVALFMDRVAQAEGNWAFQENARLKEDPSAAVPEALQQRCRELIRKDFAEKSRKQTAERVGKILLRGASVLVVLAALIALLFAAFPTLRTTVLNVFLNAYQTHADFSTNSSFFVADTNVPKVSPEWIPEGFEVEQQGSPGDRSYIYYRKGDSAALFVQVMHAVNHKVTIDTEDAVIEPIKIQTHEGTLIKKEGEDQIIWLDPEKSLVVIASGENLPLEELIKFAENLVVH